LNLYAYTGNDPLNRVDPTELQGQTADPANSLVASGTSAPSSDNSGAPKSSAPVPVVLNNGTVVQNPLTGGPLLQPAGVSLAQNAQTGRVLSLLPSGFSLPATPIREAAMAELFLPGQPMDYQRADGNSGRINRTYIAFGNYNYSVVAAAAGYTKDQALLGAGAANLLGSGNESGPLFNNPINVPFINAGYDAYKA